MEQLQAADKRFLISQGVGHPLAKGRLNDFPD